MDTIPHGLNHVIISKQIASRFVSGVPCSSTSRPRSRQGLRAALHTSVHLISSLNLQGDRHIKQLIKQVPAKYAPEVTKQNKQTRPRARQKTAWLAVDWVNWLAHGKSKWAGLTYIG